jgi:nitrogen-specific signal transduction histidine kinase
MEKFTPLVSLVDKNKVRFNKKFDPSTPQVVTNNEAEAFIINNGNRKISVRKYKLGELPDIQIATKDLIDPMLYLSGCDH